MPTLAATIDAAGRALAGLGAAPGVPVAIVLPNGPEMAAVFLAVASHAVAAPLNPAYTEDEFAFYMEDLGAKLLVVLQGNDTPARAAAARLGRPGGGGCARRGGGQLHASRAHRRPRRG
jgi:oxalate---CoA ligase